MKNVKRCVTHLKDSKRLDIYQYITNLSRKVQQSLMSN